jgi:hypothetical protein
MVLLECGPSVDWRDKSHFCAVAARLTRFTAFFGESRLLGVPATR